MSAVNIKGTFKRDSRPNNGLEAVAKDFVDNDMSPRLVVGIVVTHKISKEPGEEAIPTVRFEAIEVVTDADAVAVREILDRRRAERHQQPVQEALPWDGDGFARPEADK